MNSRLKSLELHGYKTFANRTSFEFPAQITSIVGPNGSGKSNVADALRWVLGEQSYSLLRGRKTEDMIFSGSEMRSKAGMALSSLTFNNEDGWLPIDFSEVTISRRAYRDGQNEYLLNGQRVRLKEIYELLAQSGLGQRTYTIIGQGLVDAALSLKPDERRRFFEEAAGIGLYRTRREESINRLDDTKRNLERLQDIVSELEPRLRSLEKQALRAQEYERVKADLQLILREWYGYHWHKTQKELSHAHEVLKSQESRLIQTRERFEEADNKLEIQRNRILEIRSALNLFHSDSAQLHHQWESVSKNLAVLDERQRSIQDQQINLQSDKIELERNHQTRQERLLTLEGEHSSLELDLKEALDQAKIVHKDLAEHQALRSSIETNIREIRQKQISSEKQKVELGARIRELENRLENISISKKSLDQSIIDEKRSLMDAKNNLDQADKNIRSTEETSKQAGEDLRNQQKTIGETETRIKRLNESNADLQVQKSRVAAQLEVLEQAEKSFSGLAKGAKYLLEASKNGKIQGKMTSLSQDLTVPSEYETGITAALGEFLDAVIIKENNDPDLILEWLQNGENGRAVLLPNEPTVDIKAMKANSGGDVFGIASDLIQFPQEIKDLVKVILGNVVLVRDRKTARHVLTSLPLYGRVVTLRGEVFLGNGVVIAGQDGRTGVIARPRLRKELTADLENIDRKISDFSGQMKHLQEELENQRAIEKALIKGFETSKQKLAAAVTIFQKSSLELEQARQRGEFHKKQLVDLETQVIKTREEIKKIQSENKLIESEINDLQKSIQRFYQELNQNPFEEIQAQTVHWNTKSAVIKSALDENGKRLSEFLNEVEVEKKQITSFEQRLEGVEISLIQLGKEKNILLGKEKELDSAIAELQDQIDPMERELYSLEQEYKATQDNQIAAQQAVTIGERYVSQGQLDVTRQRESLDSLRRKIEDDFGIVAFQYTTDVLSPTPLPLEGMVEKLPVISELSQGLEENVNRQRALLRRLGAVNLEAQTEYNSVKERYTFLSGQIDDLRKADLDLRKVISELDELMKKEFRKTFNAVAIEFRHTFTRLFGGGSARLYLVDEDNPADTGVEIEARLPGRREQGLMLLSGGERSLTAVALIFSLLKVSPTPFCVLDEVDAMLDEANVGRFCDLLKELSEMTQFIVITHNRNTVQTSDVIYGVTMGKDSVSQVISLRLDDLSGEMVR